MPKNQINTCVYIYLDQVDYHPVWDLQKKLSEARRLNEIPNALLLLQHPPIITIGKSGTDANLLVESEYLTKHGVELTKTDRGGDITYHGPGQLVGYPILDLAELKKDIFWYLRQIEQVIINTLQQFNIEATRNKNYTGVWVNAEKIAAIGVKVSRWITSHGFAFNINPNLEHFELIIPCGIQNKSVTSLVKIVDKAITVEDVLPTLVDQFAAVFQVRMMPFNHSTWPILTHYLDKFIGAGKF